ncbi:hypothetical protein ACFY1L_27435 [Streptomyces sp. NPDC001663]
MGAVDLEALADEVCGRLIDATRVPVFFLDLHQVVRPGVLA